MLSEWTLRNRDSASRKDIENTKQGQGPSERTLRTRYRDSAVRKDVQNKNQEQDCQQGGVVDKETGTVQLE